MAAQPFQIIPVLDFKGGKAVHAKGGRREYYQPIRSILHPSSDPIQLSRSIRSELGLGTLYLADLDAIAGSPPALEIYQQLLALGLELWIDCGVTDARSADALLVLQSPVTTLVAGLETLSGPRALRETVNRAGERRVVFSLDLNDGTALTAAHAGWASTDPLELAHEAIAEGARRLLLLDLARVGTGRGPGSVELLAQIREAYPEIELIVGGGIRAIDQVVELKNLGAAGVLLGSSLHDGSIGRRELALVEHEAADRS
jgi:phosphoribosylformimino-5-aminoimidazole carboxamide ribotide isomerase